MFRNLWAPHIFLKPQPCLCLCLRFQGLSQKWDPGFIHLGGVKHHKHWVSREGHNMHSSYSSHCFCSFAILFSRASFFCCNLCEYFTVSAANFLWSSLFSMVSSSPAAGLIGLLFSLKGNERLSPPSSTSLSICKVSNNVTTISINLLAFYQEWHPLIG